jgi:putative ABC transport system permease protein
VITIALGIGASTAIFSVTNAVLLRPLPYKDPGRLAVAYIDDRGVRSFAFTNGDYAEFRDGSTSAFETLAGVFTFRVIAPREDGRPERIYKAQVTPNFFAAMGARIIVGRDFTPADTRAAAPDSGLPVGGAAILSYEYWQRRFGGNRAIIGTELLNYRERGPRIIGVLEPGFELLLPPSAGIAGRPDVWIATGADLDRSVLSLRLIGRLKPGMTVKRGEGALETVASGIRKKYPEILGPTSRVRLVLMHEHFVAEVRQLVLSLMAASVLLLLIACANVANLLLVRASSRMREFAVRSALGGGRWKLMTPVLSEAAIVSVAGSVAGFALARIAIHSLIDLAPANLPRAETIAVDWRAFAFAAAAAFASAILSGMAPAWSSSRPDITTALRSGRGSVTPAARIERVGVAAESAVCFVLLIGSGLMVRSFIELQRIDPGYDPRGLLTFLLVRDWDYATAAERRLTFLRHIQSRLRALPGVENASASAFFPLTSPYARIQWGMDRNKLQDGDFQYVLPGFFETLRTPLIEGRFFTDADNASGRKVIVIDELLAKKAFPAGTAVGKRLFVAMPEPVPAEVIGVAAHQRVASLAERGGEQIYLTDAWAGFGIGRHWVVRLSGDPAEMAFAIRSELARLDPQLLVLEMRPVDELVKRSGAGTRFALTLITVFAVAATVLVLVGLYGVMSTAVRRRTAEIGVRMAVGAAPASIFRLVATQGLGLTAAGVTVGAAVSVVASKFIEKLLVNVKPADPFTFVGVFLLFVTVTGAACAVPARRAAKLDPATALREE